MKSAVLVSVLALTAFAVWEESALARNYLNCLSKKVVIVDAPKAASSTSAEENLASGLMNLQRLSRSQMGRSSASAALMTIGSAPQAAMCPTSWIAKMEI